MIHDELPALKLDCLPYDVLLHVVAYLDFIDLQSLQSAAKSLHQSLRTRPVYRNFAVRLLRRNRALPLVGFQRLQDLNTEELVSILTKAYRIEKSWMTGSLAPTSPTSSPCHYLSGGKTPSDTWYRVVSTPDPDVDWISPISSGYMLCATKAGRVICWDIHDETYLNAWQPEDKWELWKCRVEFDSRQVFFIMAKNIDGSRDVSNSTTDYVVMQIDFPLEGSNPKPTFTTLSSFSIPGPVMNVFLLDPIQKLFAAFIFLAGPQNIGLYCLPNWDQPEFIFIDTCITCYFPSNWSCIVEDSHIIVHCEDKDGIAQHFFPMSLLKEHIQLPQCSPTASARVPATRIVTKPFCFPEFPEDRPSPFFTHTWYPESAHFVRQWWPTLPSVPRLSCTVFLLAEHNSDGHPVNFIIAQHYFDVPISGGKVVSFEQYQRQRQTELQADGIHTVPNGAATNAQANNTQSHGTDQIEAFAAQSDQDLESEDGKPIAKMWFVSGTFEAVCSMEEDEVNEDGETIPGKCRPLVAIDFGHATWIEYVPQRDGTKTKELRFVSFPPVVMDQNGVTRSRKGEEGTFGLEDETEGRVKTLPVPEELDIDKVETINLDQSQGAILLSVEGGKVFILCYD